MQLLCVYTLLGNVIHKTIASPLDSIYSDFHINLHVFNATFMSDSELKQHDVAE